MNNKKKGFGLLELIIIISIMAILTSVVSSNLFGTQGKNAFATSQSTLFADLHHQRLKAMTGDTLGQNSFQNYGIYFDTDRYVLFTGSSYNADDPANFVVSLGDNILFFNNVLNQSQIVYLAGSGEVMNFSENNNSIGIRNTITEEQNTITINTLGTVSEIN